MRHRFPFAALLALLACGACSTPLRTEVQPRITPVPLRIATAGGLSCNGVRLDERTVATAAHCVSDGTAVTVMEAGRSLSASDVVLHPGYVLQDLETAAGFDLAKLTAPSGAVPGRIEIAPITPGPALLTALSRSGELVSIECPYLGRSGAIVELTCSVPLGWSGAPILQNGKLVGVLSARGASGAPHVVQMADATRLGTF